MRDISPALQARLQADVTTFCHCWKILRRDGRVQGFTDHDQDLHFGEVTFRASSGLLAQGHDDHLGFSVGKSDVSGALTQLEIEEEDLASGVFDGASVETWFVDWRDPDLRVLLEIETIGDVHRAEHVFHAELRALSHRLDQETGRRFLKSCSADVFDRHCGLSADDPQFFAEGTIVAIESPHQISLRLRQMPQGWLTGGQARLMSGKGVAEIRAHRQDDLIAHLQFWTPLLPTPKLGDRIRVQAGCDKSFETCGSKFNNRINFRGFPHIPGNDILFSGPNANSNMDGGSLFK